MLALRAARRGPRLARLLSTTTRVQADDKAPPPKKSVFTDIQSSSILSALGKQPFQDVDGPPTAGGFRFPITPTTSGAPPPTTSTSPDSQQTPPPPDDTTVMPSTKNPLVLEKDRSQWPRFRIYCRSSNNNTIITFTDHHGMPIAWSSGGECGFRGTRGSTPEAAYAAVVKIIAVVSAKYNDETSEKFLLDLYLSGFGHGRVTFVQTLAAPEGETIRRLLNSVTDKTPIKIGGTRAKKARRL
ncbi:translational machinery component [Hymenopellis radicata]|nr:translational machinery component [Hymenopellis radicata]